MKMHLNWVCFRAQHMQKGLEQENTPNMGVSSCSACAEGAKHEKAPKLGVSLCLAHVEGPVTPQR